MLCKFLLNLRVFIIHFSAVSTSSIVMTNKRDKTPRRVLMITIKLLPNATTLHEKPFYNNLFVMELFYAKLNQILLPNQNFWLSKQFVGPILVKID